jgi:predicted CXXCH cytochrome family protein
MCHEDKRDQMDLEHLHTPVADGNCTGCHSPHQSDYQYQLAAEGVELCFNCHEKDEFSHEFIHGPVAVGACNVCHDPHGSENEYQLIASKNKVCFECHPEIEDEANDRHPHDPVQDYCVNCHNPHSGPARLMLSQSPPQLCFECHKDIESKMASTTPHPPVAEGRCLECHMVHGSPNPRLFVRPLQNMCLECHNEMAEYLANSSNNHGPVKEGDCIACHDPHGSEQPLILRQYFPREFYNAYSTDKYSLCFNCHNKEIALDSLTTTLTDFRQGNLNLHFKHVNKKERGRSCKACHEVHASNQTKHIRKSVPFGLNWSYPIEYTKHDNGGTCVVGCHRPKTYKRDKD